MRIQGQRLGRSPETYEGNFIHRDFVRSGKQHWRYKTFCHPLLCDSSVVKNTSFLVQKWTRDETWLPDNNKITPLNLTGWIRPFTVRCNFQDWGCVILREIDFLLNIFWSIPCLHPSWKVHTWTEICASLNHRKKTKADGSRLIPGKHTETLVQWFSNCGRRTTSGTRRPSRWYAKRPTFCFSSQKIYSQL